MLKLGIIGTSIISEQLLTAVSQHNDITAHAIVSRSKEKGEEFKAKYQIPHHFNSVEEAVLSDIDAFYIASPNSLHFPQAKLALEHNKHVLLEKPFTSTLEELEELFELAHKKNLILMEAIKTIYLPTFKQLQMIIPSLNPSYVEINFCKFSDRSLQLSQKDIPNIFSPEMSGGSLVDIGVYGIWTAVELFGMPKSWTATGTILSTGVDGDGSVNLIYDGFNIKINHSKMKNQGTHLFITEENTSIIVPKFSTMPFFVTEKKEIDYDNSGLHPMYYELDNFYQLITNKGDSHWNHQHSRQVLQIMEDCRRQIGVVFSADKK